MICPATSTTTTTKYCYFKQMHRLEIKLHSPKMLNAISLFVTQSKLAKQIGLNKGLYCVN